MSSNEDINSLLITAATSTGERALESWCRYTTRYELKQVPESHSHWFPLIHTNLVKHFANAEFPYREKLQGAYKFNFVVNSSRLRHFKEIADEFDDLNIHYSLLKGCAIVVKTNLLGARRMGDCDFAVYESDYELVKMILISKGFQTWNPNKKSDGGDRFRLGWRNSVDWVDKEGYHLDLHLGSKNGRDPISACLESASRNGHLLEFSVPNANSLAITSFIHGIEGSGIHDLSNFIVDRHLLRSMLDEESLKIYLNHWNLEYLTEVFLNNTFDPQLFTLKAMQSKKIPKELKRRGNFTGRAKSAFMQIWVRRPSFGELISLPQEENVRKVSFLTWSCLGRHHRVARFLSRFGGVLRLPIETNCMSKKHAFGLIWRIRKPADGSVTVRLDKVDLFELPYVIYVEGIQKGTIPYQGSWQLHFRVENDAEIFVSSVDWRRRLSPKDIDRFSIHVQ